MSRIKEKILTLDEQIRFVQDGRKLLENDADVTLQFAADSASMMRSIEENLLTIKMWINLPHYHQAAMHVLDEAFAMDAQLERQGRHYDRPFDMLVHILSRLRNLDNASTESADEALLMEVAAMAMVGIGKFIVPKRQEVCND